MNSAVNQHIVEIVCIHLHTGFPTHTCPLISAYEFCRLSCHPSIRAVGRHRVHAGSSHPWQGRQNYAASPCHEDSQNLQASPSLCRTPKSHIHPQTGLCLKTVSSMTNMVCGKSFSWNFMIFFAGWLSDSIDTQMVGRTGGFLHLITRETGFSQPRRQACLRAEKVQPPEG